MNADIVIIGAGIVGLSTGFHLLKKHPGLKLVVLEKESGVAQHQTGHNSGVMHSGIYYKPGSEKAKNCRTGHAQLIEFCDEHGISYDICGKIIVATKKEELPLLSQILQRGIENGLEGIRKISTDEAREKEPHVRALEAVWVPQAGIIHYPDVASKYLELIEIMGGSVFFNEKVSAIKSNGSDYRIVSTNKEISTKYVVTCGGLYADKIAAMTAQEPLDFQIIPFRGEYYQLKKEKEYLVKNLIYPVPNPDFPFLGVHFTRMVKGGIEAGPNAVLAFRREGYQRNQFHMGELMETIGFPGFRKLAGKYYHEGWAEIRRSFSKRLFVKALQELIPELTPEDVAPGGAGVRAMACGSDGALIDDFLIRKQGKIIHVCNAPSPAATASLAIGNTVSDMVLKDLLVSRSF